MVPDVVVVVSLIVPELLITPQLFKVPKNLRLPEFVITPELFKVCCNRILKFPVFVIVPPVLLVMVPDVVVVVSLIVPELSRLPKLTIVPLFIRV